MGKRYGFDTDVALAVGVDEAVMLENIAFWVDKNRANEQNFHDGCYWTYNSMQAFGELFPFWTSNQLRRILNNLIGKYVVTGNYNKATYDRTLWYTLTKEGVELVFGREHVEKFFPDQVCKSTDCICEKPQMEMSETTNGFVENHEPIPYINSYNKQQIVNDSICASAQNATHSSSKDDKPKKSKETIPPTLEMVTEYIQEQGYNVNAQRFMDYYDSNGWHVGRNKMKSWKAAINSWHHRDNPQGNSGKPFQNTSRSNAIDQEVADAISMTERWFNNG